MENNHRLIISIVVILGIIGGIFLYRARSHPFDPPPAPIHEVVNQGTTLKVSPTLVPTRFPLDFPREPGAKVTKDFVYTSTVGQDSQSTLEFLSNKTIEANLKIYTDYLTKTKWTISDVLNDPAIKVITATKGSNMFNISITTDSASKKTLVTANMVYK